MAYVVTGKPSGELPPALPFSSLLPRALSTWLTTTGSNEGICPLGTYTLAIASTPWSFMACGPAPRGGDVTSYPPGECLARCPSAWAMVQRLSTVSDTEETWSCTCLALASCPNEKCSASDAVYYHRPMPTRRRRSQLPLKTGGEDELCPAPMVACAVGEEGWECIDTRSELGELKFPVEKS